MRAPEQPQDSHPNTHAKSIEKAIVLKLFGAPERLGEETQAEPHPETLTISFEKHSFRSFLELLSVWGISGLLPPPSPEWAREEPL